MSKRKYAIIFVILIATLLLSACDRSASISPVTTPTTSGEIPFPVATQSQIMKDILAATQTSSAMSGTLSTGNLPGLATSTPAFSYATPTPGALIAIEPSPTPTTLYASTEIATSAPTATSTAVVYPTATPGKPSSYTIQQGEFPFCIARRFNVNAGDLLAANGLNVYSQVSVGTVLTIPQSGTWSAGSRALKSHPASYTVAYGDTVGSIACGYGDVDPKMILSVNGLSSGTTLTQGQVLQIP
jgi:LysM repeat protein